MARTSDVPDIRDPEPDHTVTGALHGVCSAARDVPPGELWAFREHRSMAEIEPESLWPGIVERWVGPGDFVVVAEI